LCPLTLLPLFCYTHRMFLLVLVDNIYPPPPGRGANLPSWQESVK
jgi:hypothetical protein